MISLGHDLSPSLQVWPKTVTGNSKFLFYHASCRFPYKGKSVNIKLNLVIQCSKVRATSKLIEKRNSKCSTRLQYE